MQARIKQYNEITLPNLDDSAKGQLMMATTIVGAYSGDEFEQFILEWLKYCQGKITEATIIGRIGGTGDNGIDIYENTNGKVSYYQCKRYAAQLTGPQFCDIVIKVLWHAYKSEIVKPDNLFIIAYKGVNKKVLDLMSYVEGDNKLKNYLIENLRSSLGRLNVTESSDGFKQYLQELSDYKFIKKIDLDEIVKEYCQGPYALFRFITTRASRIGRVEIQKRNYDEDPFVIQLNKIVSRNKNNTILKAKEQFYSALCLKETNKYLLGSDEEYNKLKEEIASNIFVVRNRSFNDMFDRYNSIIEKAMDTVATNVSLEYHLHIVRADDKAGICHEFVNEGELFWDKEDE